VHPDALIIFGAVIDDSLGDEVRVTVVAAGFDESPQPSVKAPVPAPAVDGDPAPQVHAPEAEESWLLPTEEAPATEAAEAPAFAAESDDDSELDVPEFLR
jgi:cell division protein FtsZ